MPSCVVPGCTSGYGSNPERVHFFTIPKNPDAEKLWKSAIRRLDSAIKPGRAVCEKHFLKDQIIWSRELIDAAGRVLGVTHYKIPHLKQGSVPSVFVWTEKIPEVQDVVSRESTHQTSANNDTWNLLKNYKNSNRVMAPKKQLCQQINVTIFQLRM